MDTANHQENGGDIADDSSQIAVEDSDDEDEDYVYPNYKYLDKKVLQRLKQNDPSITLLLLFPYG